MQHIEIEKAASVVAGLNLGRNVTVSEGRRRARSGDVVAVRALSESITYGQLELASGRLAKINAGDIFLGALGSRRALKGFVGDVPETVAPRDRLHLLNMGGIVGRCTGRSSSLSEAISVEALGIVVSKDGFPVNIDTNALPPVDRLDDCPPIVMVVGTAMNSGKTIAAAELVKQATRAGFRVAAGKLSGIACLRDTLNMQDHGAVLTRSFLDCGLASTVGVGNLAPYAKAIINDLRRAEPDLIVLELGDGVLGGYSADTVLLDREISAAITSLVFCASDYVGVCGGAEVLRRMGITIDVVAGSVTDSQMGQDYVETKFGIRAANAQRDGERLFRLVAAKCLVNDLCTI
jgi:hypothetical protein